MPFIYPKVNVQTCNIHGECEIYFGAEYILITGRGNVYNRIVVCNQLYLKIVYMYNAM